MQQLLEDEQTYRQLKAIAQAKYGEKWEDHLDDARQEFARKQGLLDKGRLLLAQIKTLDERIAGLRMTPKRMRAERLAAFAEDRKRLVAEYKQAEKEFRGLPEVAAVPS